MMSIFFGTAQSYASKQALLTKWNMKKNGQEMIQTKGNLTVDMGRLAKDAQKQAKIKSITGKLKAGMRLTVEELTYLKANSPETYKKVMELEREREAYKEKLKECKTKDDVAKLQAETLGEIASQAQTISNNPNIPLNKKIELMDDIQMKIGALQDEHATFVASEDYQKLKWEYELDEEEKKAKKASEKKIKIEEEKDEIINSKDKANDEVEAPATTPPAEEPSDGSSDPPKQEAATKTPTSEATAPAVADSPSVDTTKTTPTPIVGGYSPAIETGAGTSKANSARPQFIARV